VKAITILGSTGSIGRNVLEVVSQFPEKFKVVGLTSNRRVDILTEQIRKFNPQIVAIGGKEEAEYLKKTFPSLKIEAGEEGIEKVARQQVDLVVVSIVGMAGLKPALSAIKAGNDIALANKEILVAGGETFMNEIRKAGINLFPLDSEHCAIFQILENTGKILPKRSKEDNYYRLWRPILPFKPGRAFHNYPKRCIKASCMENGEQNHH